MIDYVKLFSSHPLNIVPELIKDCEKDSIWNILSDYIREHYNQNIVKSGYLLILDSYNEFCLTENKDEDTYKIYSLHMDILWNALSDENCAKLELHIRQ